MLPSRFIALLFAAVTLAVTVGAAPQSYPWSTCATSVWTTEFTPSSLLVYSNDNVTSPLAPAPGSMIQLLFSGALTETVSAGTYTALWMYAPSSSAAETESTATAERLSESASGINGSIVITEHVGSLSEITWIKYPLPIAANTSAHIGIVTAIPPTVPMPAAGTNATLTLRLEMLTVPSLDPLMCVQVDFTLSTPPLPPSPPASTSKVLGYSCALISVFCFGTNFLPVKAYDTGDGMFFQWVMCLAIWLCGLFVQIIRFCTANTAIFEPFAMLGGVLWCTGNIASVPVIQLIGLGVGMVLWVSRNTDAGMEDCSNQRQHYRQQQQPARYQGCTTALSDAVAVSICVCRLSLCFCVLRVPPV